MALTHETLGDRIIVYPSNARFFVDFKKHARDGYTTLHTVKGNLNRAVELFNEIEVSGRNQKRVYSPDVVPHTILHAKAK